MRILVCGDRNWTKKRVIYNVLKFMQIVTNLECIIEGEARGADKLSRICAEQLGIKVIKFPANWKKYGKAAGSIRNMQMLKEGKPNIVLAFHNNIEQSKGTKHMVSIARKNGIRVRVIKSLSPRSSNGGTPVF